MTSDEPGFPPGHWNGSSWFVTHHSTLSKDEWHVLPAERTLRPRGSRTFSVAARPFAGDGALPPRHGREALRRHSHEPRGAVTPGGPRSLVSRRQRGRGPPPGCRGGRVPPPAPGLAVRGVFEHGYRSGRSEEAFSRLARGPLAVRLFV